ncbi:MAG: YihY/virulence factor BrkB family protein [Anaerolineae bacterium]|nr:MAG: YihY/virulence factor BrkB family protein [Anaerolineae bacterium]
MNRLKAIVSILFAAGQKFAKDRSTRLAAALSFYLMISVAPLLIIVAGIITQVLSRLLTADFIAIFLERSGLTAELLTSEEIIPFLENIIGSEATAWLDSIVSSVSAPTSMTLAAIISLVVMFWGASNVFNHLKETLNIIWGVRAAPGAGIWLFVRGRLLAFGAVLGLGVFLTVFLLLNTIVASLVSLAADFIPDYLEFLPTWRAIQIVQFIVAFVVVTIIFSLIFKMLPDVQIAWRDVIVGALVTAFLFTIGTIGLAIYFQFSTIGSLYGAAGSLIVVLFWFYYSSQIFLFGAEFTQVYATQYGALILPAEHAVAYSLTKVEKSEGNEEDANLEKENESAGTILGAPKWFLALTGKIEGLFSKSSSAETSDEGLKGD